MFEAFQVTFGFCMGILLPIFLFIVAIFLLAFIIISFQWIVGELSGSNREHREAIKKIKDRSEEFEKRKDELWKK